MHEVKSLSNDQISVLVLSTNDNAYSDFKNAIRNTWFKEMQSKGIKCYFYSGDHEVNRIEKDEIYINVSDKLEYTSLKLQKALDMLLSHDPDIKLIYRTNLSSYIDPSNFIKFINTKRLSEKTYAGLIGYTSYFKEYFYGNRVMQTIFNLLPLGKKIKFASGSGFFIGRDQAMRLLPSQNEYAHLIDDVMVALTLGVEPDERQSPLRFDIGGNNEHKISGYEYQKLIENGMLFHYRFKTSNRAKDAAMLGLFSDPAYRLSVCISGYN